MPVLSELCLPESCRPVIATAEMMQRIMTVLEDPEEDLRESALDTLAALAKQGKILY